ncbi:10756_t:CDS:2, partial [Dentiscutata heterogama]
YPTLTFLAIRHPWNPSEIKIINRSCDGFTVPVATEILRRISINPRMSQANITEQSNRKHWIWKRLREAGDCPWCPKETQDLGHFRMKCRISKQLWERRYEWMEPRHSSQP